MNWWVALSLCTCVAARTTSVISYFGNRDCTFPKCEQVKPSLARPAYQNSFYRYQINRLNQIAKEFKPQMLKL